MAAVAPAATAAAPAAPAVAAPAPAAAAGPAKTSLYVGDLNADVTEGQLFDIFSALGPVSTVRVCRHAVTRESLGYAYVNFQNTGDAERAIAELNYSPIKGRSCRIMWSQRDPALRRTNVGNVFVKNLGPAVTSQALHETCKIFGTILSCKVATDARGASKGYGFVHFETEEAAVKCIAVLHGMEWADRIVEAKPYVPRAQRAGPEWNNLYAKNLPAHVDEKALRDLFAPFGEIVSHKLVTDPATGKSRGFGFVCFRNHGSAVDAERELNGKEIEGVPATLPPKVAAKLRGDVPKKKEGGEGAAEVPEKKAAEETADEAAAALKEKEDAAAAAAAASAPRKLRLFVGRAQKKGERERALREAREAARRDRVARFAGCNVYVRNLDESVDDETLRREFAPYGSITSAMVARAAGDARSKLFGYVCFAAPEEAAKAIAAMHKRLLAGKPLYVQLWQSKEQRVAAAATTQRAAGARGAAGAAGPAAGPAAGANPALAASLMGNPLAALMAANPMFAAGPAGAMAALQQQGAGRGAPAGAANPAAAAQQQQYQQVLMFFAYMQQLAMAAQQNSARQQMAGAPVAGRGPVPMGAGAAAGRPGPMDPAALAMSMFGNPAAFQALQQASAGVPAGGLVPGAAGRGPAAAAAPAGAAGAAGRRGAPAGVAPGGTRVAAGPAAAGGRAIPGAPGAPTAAAIAAGTATARGAASPAAKGAAAGKGAATGAAAGAAPAAAMAYNAVARNVGVAATPDQTALAMQAQLTAAVPAAAAAAAPARPAASGPAPSFASQLASATPDQRKHMIGEQLYALIARSQGGRAGKITGMLLEGMDEGELLHLLESPADLEERIREALDVLAQVADSGKA